MNTCGGNAWLQAIAGVVLLIASGVSPAEEADDLTPFSIEGALPDFTLLDNKGSEIRLSDYRGQVVLVTFWALWCPQCLWEMPSLERLWQGLQREGLMLLAVNVGEDAATVAVFNDNNNLSFPVLLDSDLAVYTAWPLLGLPTSFLLDRNGKPAYRAVGALDWQDPGVVAIVRDLLSDKAR